MLACPHTHTRARGSFSSRCCQPAAWRRRQLRYILHAHAIGLGARAPSVMRHCAAGYRCACACARIHYAQACQYRRANPPPRRCSTHRAQAATKEPIINKSYCDHHKMRSRPARTCARALMYAINKYVINMFCISSCWGACAISPAR